MATLPNTYAARPVPQDRSSFVSVPENSRTAAAMSQLAGVVGEFGDRLQQQQDIAAVSGARRQLDDWERQTIFDPEKGAINKRGKDSFGVTEELQKSFDETAGKIGKDLTARQQRVFQDVANGRRNQVLSWANGHVLKERDRFDEGEYQADVKSFQERASFFPDKAPAEIAMMDQRTIGYLRSKGRSESEINQAVIEQRDKAHIGVVGSFLDNDDDASAQKYFDANRAGMSAAVRAQVGNEVKARGNLIQAQRNADSYAASGTPETQAIEETRKKFQGKAEEAAVQQLRTRYAERDAAQIREVKQVSNSAWSVLMAKGSMSAIPAQTMATLRAVAPEEERQMRDWLQAKAIQSKALAKSTFEPDDQLYIGLRRMAMEDPVKFQTFVDAKGLEKSAPKLSDGQMGSLLAVAQGIDRKDTRAMESNRVVASTLKAVDAQIRVAGLKRSAKPDTSEAMEYAKFQTALTNALDAKMAEKKAPLTDQEARAVAAGMLRQGIEQGSGFLGFGKTVKRGYEIAADPALAGKTFVSKTFGDIPEDARAALRAKVIEKEGYKGPRNSISADQEATIERMYQQGIEAGIYK